ncbi:MAG: CPBP family intramembrane metalloprotease [Actinobacteria bacterium]|nr:CPBP family intramembrane metalloprotease [Actinomycetota bacterium]MBU2687142.1 CPBP family intramembrane metalloprotease [Actinomycetota bacterium]
MSAERCAQPGALAGAGVEVAATAMVLGYGVLLDRVLPELSHVPVNVAAAGLAVFLANRAGASMDDMGLDPSRLASGLKLGLLTVAPIAAAVAVGLAVPWTREFFLDSDVVGASGARSIYELLVRIPLGTALAEELIFRGALMGVFLKRRSPLVAALLSSAVFGVWHISPTLQSLSTNAGAARAATGFWAGLGIVSGVVAVTAAAGAGLAWLRLRSGSIVAPWIAHTCLNSFAWLGGRIANVM